MRLAKSFWSYQADPPPQAPSGISDDDWESLSPGMRREIYRTNKKFEEKDERS